MEPWQARSSEFHPYSVDRLEEMPQELQDRARAALPSGALLQAAFVVPEEEWEGKTEAAQALLFTQTGVVQVTLSGAPLQIDAATLLWLRSSHLLLHGRIELVAAAEGRLLRLVMAFNAIGWRLIQPAWQALVGRAIGRERGGAHPPFSADRVAGVPEKFVDGLERYGLYTGEALVGAVFQPALWSSGGLAGDEQQLHNTLVVLTDASVLVLEEERALVRRSEQLGLIITRMPLRAVEQVVEVPGAAHGQLEFVLTSGGCTDRCSVSLAAEALRRWALLWASRSQPEGGEGR
ncbi:MAG: hypothetical protein KGS73_16565 [Chloroflexi bacterium]|nr:hypothetical protein [Chloroflexota bacterium]